MTELSPLNDRGISPVIGVVLMVGIVVALGAVIGTAVLSTGTAIGDTAPQSQFETTYNDDGSVTITHVSGDPVATEDITVNDKSGTEIFTNDSGDPLQTLQAGDSGSFTPSNSTITMTWGTADTTATLLSEQTPSGFTTTESVTPTVSGNVLTTDGFESGTYTNTFRDFIISGGNSPIVTETNPADGQYRLELETTSTETSKEEVSVLSNQISNTSGVTVDVNKYADDGGDNRWKAHFMDSGYSIKVYENADGTVILEEQKDTEDTIIDNKTITTNMEQNTWETLAISLDDGSVTASLGSDKATLNTERNWNQSSTYFELSAVSNTGDSKIGLGVDNYTMKTTE